MSESFRSQYSEFGQSSRIGKLLDVRTAKSYGSRVLAAAVLSMFVLNAGPGERVQARDRLSEKSRNLVISRVEFRDSTVRECIDFLRETSRKVENTSGFTLSGVNFVLKLGQEELRKAPRVNFQAENLSLLDAVKEITRQANLDYRIARYAIEIGKANGFAAKFPTKSFLVPPIVFPEYQVHFSKGSELATYVRFDVRRHLRKWGLVVPEQGAAYYFPATYELSVSGTEELFGSIESIVVELVARHRFPAETPIADLDTFSVLDRGYGVRVNSRTSAKLQRIIFPRVEMIEATPEEAFEFFFRKTKELDTTEANEALRGIRGSLAPRPESPGHQPGITLSLEEVPAIDALMYMTDLAGLKYEIQLDGIVSIQPRSSGPEIETRTYSVPSERMNVAVGSIAGPDGVTYSSVRQLFSAFGVAFPEGASAGLTADKGIVVRNTERNLAIVDVVVAALFDSRNQQLSPKEVTALRAIIADAQANGEIRPPKFLFPEA
jgi:hypothetical protein